MSMTFWLPLIVLSSSLVTGLIIFVLPEERSRVRTMLNMAGATVKVAGVFLMAWGLLAHGIAYEVRFTMGLGSIFCCGWICSPWPLSLCPAISGS